MAWNAELSSRAVLSRSGFGLIALLAGVFLPAAALATATASTASMPAYSVTGTPVVAQWSGDGPRWSGDHSFLNVFCLRAPAPASVSRVAEALFNNGSLYFSRIDYPQAMALYVVTSTMPAHLDRHSEHTDQKARARQLAEQIPTHAVAGEVQTALGTNVTLRLRNVLQGDLTAPFPFERRFAGEPDSPLQSLSVHQLFSNNGSRIELAALRFFEPALTREQEAGAVASLEAFVAEAADSLAQCTANQSQSGSDSRSTSASEAEIAP